MCGIAGYYGKAAVTPTQILASLETMRRRGPDHIGAFQRVFADGSQVVLLHSRLSIIDLCASSNQPMRRGDDVLVYNGELYNYVEVRNALRAEGVDLETDGDTEVLLAALRHWGDEALDRCDGMWAFAWFNEARRELTLCRDRFGEKPLHVMETAEGLFFASEIKAIAALRGSAPGVDEDQLQRYLVNGYKALCKRDRTFFRGVRKVLPGRVMTISGRGMREREYWSPRYAPDDGMSYGDAVDGVRAALRESVRMRLRADVPIAFCLSGGVDSNALVATAKKQLGADVHAFTVVLDDDRYDEREIVAQVVGELSLRHTTISVTRKGFRDRLTDVIGYHDAPLYTVTSYVQWLMMEQIARLGYRVVVTGVGADELLSGYYDHHNLYLEAMSGTNSFDSARGAWERHVAPVVRNPFLKNPDLFIGDPGFRDHIFLDSLTYSDCLRSGWWESFAEERYAGVPLRNRMLNELRHESVPAILHEDDLNAMYYSLENRAPYLSPALCDFCGRIPTRHLMRDALSKAPLRDAMRGTVPDVVLDRRVKVGFNAPIAAMIDPMDGETRAWLLDDGPVFEHVRRDRIEGLLSADRISNSLSKFLFGFVCAKVFLESNGRYLARSMPTSRLARIPGPESLVGAVC